MQRVIRILCVDDNEHVASAIRLKLEMIGGFSWVAHLPDATTLAAAVGEYRPDIVLLDLDMPGPNPLTVLREVVATYPQVRGMILSGHLTRELIEQSLDAGAWGYVHKGDDVRDIINAIQRVAAGEMALSPDVQATLVRP